MKYFFGCTFMSLDELTDIGVKYPIKLEYYKTTANEEEKQNNEVKYGIEVVKTSYIKEKVDIERKIIPNILTDEPKIDNILNKLKVNKVTPISAEYIIEDLLKENELKK